MAIFFNSVLAQSGLDPKDVLLLRHKDSRAGNGLYELWRNDPAAFDRYQSRQNFKNRSTFQSHDKWATFVVTPSGETLFIGLYDATYEGPLKADMRHELRDEIQRAGSVDWYNLDRLNAFDDLAGRLIIDWGSGARAWVQHAKRQNKLVNELRREFQEPEFPGYLNFVSDLTHIANLYPSWVESLKACKGIYLLTCPRTKEQYVGKADGDRGFWQRWQAYLSNGHGGNIVLKTRDPADYQVSILEVAGSAATSDDIAGMESRWKQKLHTRETGLNRN